MNTKISLGFGILLTESELGILQVFAPAARFKLPADYYSGKEGAFSKSRDQMEQYEADLERGEQEDRRPVISTEFTTDLICFSKACPFIPSFYVSRAEPVETVLAGILRKIKKMKLRRFRRL